MVLLYYNIEKLCNVTMYTDNGDQTIKECFGETFKSWIQIFWDAVSDKNVSGQLRLKRQIFKILSLIFSSLALDSQQGMFEGVCVKFLIPVWKLFNNFLPFVVQNA